MKKIEIISRTEKLEKVKEVLNKLEIHGMTVSMISGCGNQKGRKEFYRGAEININLLPKMKIEIIATDEKVNLIVEEIVNAISTGQIGDGKIFIIPVEDAVRIRTGERGESVL